MTDIGEAVANFIMDHSKEEGWRYGLFSDANKEYEMRIAIDRMPQYKNEEGIWVNIDFQDSADRFGVDYTKRYYCKEKKKNAKKDKKTKDVKQTKDNQEAEEI